MEILNVAGIWSRPERSHRVLEQGSENYASQVDCFCIAHDLRIFFKCF